jgi:3-hydroxyisobutyrate dehydrogenase-like beta-hydroxyacid dehydrogenase
MNLTMIGFGEAAQAMARGFAGEPSRPQIRAYDVRLGDAATAPALKSVAEETGVTLCASLPDALAAAEIVLSLVPGSAASAVAEAVAPHLGEDQIYVDLSSISPGAKVEIGAVIADGRGRCVEGAIMDAVTPRRHRVPILLAGPDAGRCATMLNAFGMMTEAVGPDLGQASAVKMIRSVMIKGVEALILEAMTAAEIAGVTERILDSVDKTFEGLDWRLLTSHYLRRTHEHGLRRVSEMKESAATLRGLGLEPHMSVAIASAIARGHTALAARPYDPAAGYRDLLPVLAGAAKTDAPA